MSQMTIIFNGITPIAKANNYKKGKKSFYKPSTVKNQEKDIIDIINQSIADNNWKLSIKPLEIEIHFHYLDNRKRDIDNPLKSLLDCGNKLIYKDDSQIVKLVVYKHLKASSKRTVMTVREIG